jgi:hypothetical protein
MVRSVTDVELQDGVHAIGPDEGVRLLDVWKQPCAPRTISCRNPTSSFSNRWSCPDS